MPITLPNNFTPRPYQLDTLSALDAGVLRSVDVWPRRAGKDLTFAHYTAKRMFQRVGLYLHLLPSAKQARKVVWDAIDNDGRRVLDWVFPKELRDGLPNETEMKLRFKNGSIWQLAGADYFDALVGSNPVGFVMSEAALTDPMAWNYLRPILAGNGGWAAFISTPRGYNWFWRMLKHAKTDPAWHWSHLTTAKTQHISQAALDAERREMPDELFRQEYECDFSAANVGAILGAYIERAEREGRIVPYLPVSLADKIVVSSDIGYRDKAAFWWWRIERGGFSLVDYDEASGLDAEEWIPRIKTRMRPDTLYLPHDARARTFATRHTVVSQFLEGDVANEVRISPLTRKHDSINAARTVLKHCRFDSTKCAEGLEALRNWSFEYKEDNRSFSAEPKHDWSSHGSDAFCEGAKVLQEFVPKKVAAPTIETPATTPLYGFGSLDSLWSQHDRESRRRRARVG